MYKKKLSRALSVRYPSLAASRTPASGQAETPARRRPTSHARTSCCQNCYPPAGDSPGDRKSTRLNSSHITISYAVFCLKKKKKKQTKEQKINATRQREESSRLRITTVHDDQPSL